MKRNLYLFFLIIAILATSISFLQARPKLPYFFSDNMVLQQQSTPAIWGSAKANTSISIISSWNKKKYTTLSNSAGKWTINISTPTAGGPFELTISDGEALVIKNILIGEVWLFSGQSNMEVPMKGYRDQPINGSNDAIFQSTNQTIRLFTVPQSISLSVQDTIKETSWKLAEPETVANFSATAYYFGKYLSDQLQVPIGLVNISYGGSPIESFMDANTLASFPEIKIPSISEQKINNRTPTSLFNGMLAPFIGYGIKGCVWYQGESNNTLPQQYEQLMPAFVKQIRSQFKLGDFPFYYAQIAPFNYASITPANAIKYNSAFLREAQLKAAAIIPNAGMAVLMDLGEELNIHPSEKEIGSKRLAYMALAKTYGLKGFAYSSPIVDSVNYSGNIATIKFNGAKNGLTSFGKPLNNFEIAGKDKIFHPAKALIIRGTVLVSALEVREPVALRYAFYDFVKGDLFSTEGFPISSFRTDNW